MDKYQAEEIIRKYGGAIAQDKSVFKKQSDLPCSKANIRYAYYVYIAAIIDDFGCLPEKVGENLVATYSMLDAFLSDAEIDRLNKTSARIENNQLNKNDLGDMERIKEYFSLANNALRNGSYFDEINEYIGECLKAKKSLDQSAGIVSPVTTAGMKWKKLAVGQWVDRYVLDVANYGLPYFEVDRKGFGSEDHDVTFVMPAKHGAGEEVREVVDRCNKYAQGPYYDYIKAIQEESSKRGFPTEIET